MNFEVVPVVAIVVICYAIGIAVKTAGKIDKWIPTIVTLLGGVLGCVGMYVIPEYPAGNVLDAIAVGIASGAASTGVNQIYKQLKKGE